MKLSSRKWISNGMALTVKAFWEIENAMWVTEHVV